MSATRKPMTLEAFLRRLRKTPRRWDIDAKDRIRVDGDLACQCPIEAVAGVPRGQALAAADQLGLARHLTARIMSAADFPSSRRYPTRERLLRACGLAS